MRTRFVLYAAVLGLLGFILAAKPFAAAEEPLFEYAAELRDERRELRCELQEATARS